MKKFVFSLEALLQVKKTLKDKQQAEYAAARAALEQALRIKAGLDGRLADETEAYEAKVKKGILVCDMQAHAVYTQQLQEMIRAAAHEVARAQEEAGRRQAVLVETFKEIKVLDKLRRRQYAEYLAEAGKQETKAREDMLSAKVAGAAARQDATGAAS